MKISASFSQITFLALVCLSFTLMPQRVQAQLKKWTETTVADFSDNDLHNLDITQTTDGEVILPHPLNKTGDDQPAGDTRRFVARDANGNFVDAWLENENLFVQKFAANGQALTSKKQANTADNSLEDAYHSSVALMDNGAYCVVWKDNSGGDDPRKMFGQIFDAAGNKIGANFRINDRPNNLDERPVVFANNHHQSFWIIFTETEEEGSRILVQKRNLSAEQIGEVFKLNPKKITVTERRSSVATGADFFVVTWYGYNKNSSDYTDIYYRKFNLDGNAIDPIIKVNDDNDYIAQGQPDIAIDANNRFVIAWFDMRNNTSEYHHDIYAQYHTAEGAKIGKNFHVNSTANTYCLKPDVDFNNGHFTIKYSIGYSPDWYLTHWNINFITEGHMISSIFDCGPDGANFDYIDWRAGLPDQTSVFFQLRSTSDTLAFDKESFYGPNGPFDYYQSPRETINAVHNGDRYIQYKAFIETGNPGITPSLQWVSIAYYSADTLAPSAPAGVQAEAGHSQVEISWQAASEPDFAQYKIYRGQKMGSYNTSWSTENTTFVDTSAVSGTRYYYVVTAIDSAHNESPHSSEVKATPFSINIYADATASGGGDGSFDQPFANISAAVRAAHYGDNIFILPGSYPESVHMKKGVNLIGSGAHCTEILGYRSDYIIYAANESVISGFTIKRTGSKPVSGILCDGVSPEITGNVLLNTMAGSHKAIVCRNGARPKILKNFIKGFEMGVYVLEESLPEIRNNVIDVVETGIFCLYTGQVPIINNTIFAETYGGIEIIHYTDAIIKNNIVVSRDSAQTHGIRDADDVCTILYNDAWNHSVNYVVADLDASNLSVDPLFVNGGSQNYQLQPESPCRDSGDPAEAFNDTDGSRNDMGAFGGPDPIDGALTSTLIKSIALNRISGFPGDTVRAFVRVDEPDGVARADFSLHYDPQILTALEVSKTATTSAFDLNAALYDGAIEINFEASSAIEDGQPELLSIDFVVNDAVSSGEASALSFGAPLLKDGQGNDIVIESITDGVFIVNQGSSEGRYVYVDAASATDGDGTRKSPFRTIGAAINAAAAGDTIVVAGGDYHERFEIDKEVYLRGAGSSVTAIVAPEDEVLILFKQVPQGEISGFTIRAAENELPSYPLIRCSASAPLITKNRLQSDVPALFAIQCEDSSSANIVGNAFFNLGIEACASDPLISDNYIRYADQGISCVEGARPLIEKNRIYPMIGAGVAISASESAPVIRNNILDIAHHGISFTNTDGGSVNNNIFTDKYGTAVAFDCENAVNLNVLNNTFCNLRNAIITENASVMIMNNIAMNCQYSAFYLAGDISSDYNDFWNNSINYESGTPGENDLFSDPLFVDTDNGNFHLQSASPCIDAGHPDAAYNDIDGTRNDMGAYGGPFADPTAINSAGSILKMDSLNTSPDDTVTLYISGDQLDDVAELQTTLSFDPRILTFINARSTNLTKDFALQKSTIGAHSVKLNLSAPRGLNQSTGELVELKFIVNPVTQAETTIKFENASLCDETSGEKNVVTMNDGKIFILGTALDEALQPETPRVFRLFQNYPNPFNATTTFRYQLNSAGRVVFKIYDIRGREVRTLEDSQRRAGSYETQWDGRNNLGMPVASGMYFFRLSCNQKTNIKKALLIK